MEVEFEAVLYFALKSVLFTNTVVANMKDGASLSTEKPARYCTQLPCLSVFHTSLSLLCLKLPLSLNKSVVQSRPQR